MAETTGIVESSGFVPSDIGPSSRVVSVRLSDGTLVQAEVSSPTLIRPGQVAKLRVYRRVLSGAPSYEVIGVEAK